MEIIKKVLKQTSWQIFGKASNVIFTLIILGLITKNYGKEGTGIYTLVLAYLSVFALFSDLGLNSHILSKQTHTSEETNKLLNARVLWSLILAVIASLTINFLPFSSPILSLSVLIGSTALVFMAIFNTTNLVFQGNLRYDRANIANALGSFLIIPLVVWFVYLKLPITFMVLGWTVNWFVTSLLALLLVKNIYVFRFALPKLKFIKKILFEAWPISLTLIANVIYFRVDSFILTSYFSYSEAGIYNLAYQIFQNLLILPTFIMNSYFPIMLLTMRENFGKFLKQVRLAGVMMLLLSLIVGVFAYFLAGPFIMILSGSGFLDSAEVLRILCFSLPAFFVSSILMWTFVSLKRYKQMLYIYLFGLVLNLLLNIIFIPKYSYFGSAWVTTICEYLILILQVVILTRSKGRQIGNGFGG